ncbi:MAG: fimbrial assembly protein FimA [Candidatus Eremiobacteraeota bacterium]|nr:fimbrial assembly protein FimA [Candidatus Eremiobacteraeota bacterium]
MLSTFSIVAADPGEREIGIAVQSKFLAVGAVVPWAESKAGAIATQAWANTSFGPRALELLRAGEPPELIVQTLIGHDENADDRQFGIVDAEGRSATFTGARCIDWAGGVSGENFAAQGNCLAGPSVVSAMAETFRSGRGHLAGRLVAALAAGQREGGDKRGQQSAALLVLKPGGGYGGFNDRYVDLRVDDHATPIDELARLLQLHELYHFPAAPSDVLRIDDALGREIVAQLVRVGALAPRDGCYDDAAHDALVAFMHVENLENRVRADRTIDRQTLDYLRAFSPKHTG